jgi:hypothetical protein
MKTYIKPSGVEVEVNPNSYDLAESLGWKVKSEKPAEVKEPVKQVHKHKGK